LSDKYNSKRVMTQREDPTAYVAPAYSKKKSRKMFQSGMLL